MESSCFAVVKAKEKSCGNSFDCSGITCLDINWILCKALVEIWRCILSCGKQIYAVIRNIRRVEHTLIFNIFSPHHLWSPRRHWRDLQRLLNPLSLKRLRGNYDGGTWNAVGGAKGHYEQSPSSITSPKKH